MIYNVNDRPPILKQLAFAFQMVMSVFVATALIANICGRNVDIGLVGAGAATMIYLIITGFKSPMFISNSGAFVAPVLMASAIGGYSAVIVGGLTTAVVYCLFGILFCVISTDYIYKIFPKALIGAVTIVIGINLMPFILTYVQTNGVVNGWGISAALITTLTIAIVAHYAKGFAKILPFLIGTLVGYGYSVVITLLGLCKLVDFSVFNGMTLFSVPDFAFNHMEVISFSSVVPVIIIYGAYTVSAMMECLSDTAALSNIIDVDLYDRPGIGRIFIGEGFANIASSCIGGLGACSYGESVACIGFSRVASVRVTALAAIMLAILGFINPVQVFISSIPSCVFAGAAIILYGFIACSGIKMLQDIDLDEQKNLVIVSAVLSLGISGIVIGGSTISFSATALALIVGVVLNLTLKDE